MFGRVGFSNGCADLSSLIEDRCQWEAGSDVISADRNWAERSQASGSTGYRMMRVSG